MSTSAHERRHRTVDIQGDSQLFQYPVNDHDDHAALSTVTGNNYSIILPIAAVQYEALIL